MGDYWVPKNNVAKITGGGGGPHVCSPNYYANLDTITVVYMCTITPRSRG